MSQAPATYTIQRTEELATDYLVLWFQLRAPKKTGRLALTIRKAFNPSTMGWEVIIGDLAAPYAVYTNEPWIAAKWNGRKNPNEGWVQEAIRDVVPTLQQILSGAISESEALQMMSQTSIDISDQLRGLHL